jgi:hypothetical protein
MPSGKVFAMFRRPPLLAEMTIALGLLLSPGCSDDTDAPAADGGTDGPVGQCPSGLKAAGSACIPVLDDCQGHAVPIPGGGCKPIGVEECTGGLKLPSDASCTRVGPPATCPTGWTAGSDGLCAPVLPTAACSGATMEVIGKASCQPVGDCGTGTWGKITGGATTIYVDQSYTGGGSDGSSAKPYTTVAAAAAAATAGGHLAIAAGAYQENIKVAKQLTIEGRCPEMVTINDQGTAGVAIQVSAKGVTVRGLTLKGKGRAIQVIGGTAQVEQVVVDGCGAPGIEAVQGGEITIQDSVIRASTEFGIAAFRSTVTLERSVVRDTQQKAGEIVCAGIYGLRMEKTPAVLTVKNSLLANNAGLGLNIWGSSATLEGTVVRDTQGVSGGVGGWGIYADWEDVPAQLTVRDSLLANNGSVGLHLSGSDGTLERTTVRDTQNADGMGSGIVVTWWKVPGVLSLRDSAVVDGKSEGVFVAGADATIERTLIKGSAASGIVAVREIDIASEPSSLTVRDSIVADNVNHGISVYGSTGVVERTLIRDTSPKAPDSASGQAIAVGEMEQTKATLSLVDSLLTESHYLGMSVFDSDATLERSVVQKTKQVPGSLAKGGFGILAGSVKGSASLTLRDSLIYQNTWAGVGAIGAVAKLERSAVRGTRTDDAIKRFGHGIIAGYGNNQAAQLTVQDCLVHGSLAGGLSISSSKATVERSIIAETTSDVAAGEFGDGISVSSAAGQPKAELSLADSLVSTSARAGVLFVAAGGTVSRSAVREGTLAIVLEEGADPTIAKDNVFEANEENSVSYSKGLKPAPLPTVPPPPSSP